MQSSYSLSYPENSDQGEQEGFSCSGNEGRSIAVVDVVRVRLRPFESLSNLCTHFGILYQCCAALCEWRHARVWRDFCSQSAQALGLECTWDAFGADGRWSRQYTVKTIICTEIVYDTDAVFTSFKISVCYDNLMPCILPCIYIQFWLLSNLIVKFSATVSFGDLRIGCM